MVSVNGCAQRSPQLAFRSNANPMGYERPPAGGSQRPVAPPMKLCRCLDTGRSPKPSVTHVTPDQARLAKDAVTKLEGHKANRLAQTKARSLGKKPKTEEKSK